MKNLKDYILEFQGWPDWDEKDDITSVKQAADIVKANKDFQKYGWNYFYGSCDDKMLDYLSDLTDDELKEEFIAWLGLTGMLSKDVEGFEFTEPVKDKLSLYTDEIGDDDITYILAYDKFNISDKLRNLNILDMRHSKRGYGYIDSKDLDQKDFPSSKLPRHGLCWAFCSSGYSATVPGYWCKDNDAKEDMKEYCGLVEFKKGKKI